MNVDPVATDTRIVELERQIDRIMAPAASVFYDARSLYGLQFSNRRVRPQELVDRLAADDSPRAAALLATLAELEEQAAPFRAEANELDELWRAERWSRFYLVTNSNGHIHSSTRCSTCRIDTQFGWLPELSGLTEADAVEAHGAILCTVCFPSAPVEWTGGESKAAIEAREAREAAKAEREAKKEAKRLVPGSDDGIVVDRHRIKTVAAAKSFLTNGYDWGWGHPSYSPDARDAVAAAMVGRPGVKEDTVEAILAAAKKRAAKRK
ncbi:MAG: hypothetical protein ACOYOQ_14305 [Microthrixaceae bacterium]